MAAIPAEDDQERERGGDWQDPFGRSRAELRDEAEGVPRLEWVEFARMWAPQLHGGEHITIIASTGDGKTHMIRWGILPLYRRDPVLIIDAKRDQGTLSTYGGCGRVMSRFPGYADRLRFRARRDDSPAWAKDPEVWRLRPAEYRWKPGAKTSDRDYQAARRLVGGAIDRVLHEGRWALVVDDVALVTDKDPPGLDLGAPMRAAWKLGRDKLLTVIAATQEPVSVPSEMWSQPSHIFLGGTTDERRYERMGEIGGDRRVIQVVVSRLAKREFLYVHGERGPDGRTAKAIVTAPPARTG